MSANPPRNDKWPLPAHCRHVWVKLNPGMPVPAPYPGVILKWEHEGSVELGTRRSYAWVTFIEEDARDFENQARRVPRQRFERLESKYLRPAWSNFNDVW